MKNFLKQLFRRSKSKPASSIQFGLALSGGAARGAAHIGVLQVLEENNIRPKLLSGTSAGAMVACFYADGYSPKEILGIIEEENPFKGINLTFPRKGIFNSSKLFNLFSNYLKADNLEDLDLPVYIGVTDYLKGKLKVISSGSIAPVLKATCAIPVLFDPVEVDGCMCYDGGLMNNLPIEPLEGNCDKIIGSYVNPVGEVERIGNFRSLIVRSVLIGVNANMKANIPKCDIYIEPQGLSNFSLTDSSRYREMYEIGYNEAQKVLKNYFEK